MRYLKNNTFERDLKDHHLDDRYIKDVLDDIFDGRAVSLGSKMYKIRTAGKDRGKRGGFRSVFFWKKNELIIFCVLFGKNEQDNLKPDEKKALSLLSYEYQHLTDAEIQEAIRQKLFEEIHYDQKT